VKLDDFSHLIYGREEEKDREVEELRRKLEEMEISFREKIEREKEASFLTGLKEGERREREKLKKKMEVEMGRIREEYEKKLNENKVNIKKVYDELRERIGETVTLIENVILDAILEILEFLYISKANSDFVRRAVEKICDEFRDSEIELEVGKNLAEALKENGFKVKVNDKLEPNDFKIKLKNFSIESLIKEKIRILKEELEREVKKLS